MSRLQARIDWSTALAQSGEDVLRHELQAEKASALGAAGRRLERALAALASDDGDQARLNAASRAAWEFMVMREMAGLRDWSRVVRMYGIPPQVLHRMGAAATLNTAGTAPDEGHDQLPAMTRT